ncbi:hypothetical protein [Stenomitos frigidus]|uniref:Uncharacterized protein n=1 Tax=Stenomitos frigidus ULC18 TaxID=2107698 RepID=A0A2T1EB46_9CYAN|nr:hypothetical protein [Stenomitos frigidus]PSB29915.1 hypothetical protein C7B82_10200 [Stenomitos frigidus ULC18]
MKDQPRLSQGTFASQYKERRGAAAIALRLPVSLDAQVRAAAGWQSKEDNEALRVWVEQACRSAVSGQRSAVSQAAIRASSGKANDVATVRAAANRVAMTIQPRNRALVMRAFDALLGELVAGEDG